MSASAPRFSECTGKLDAIPVRCQDVLTMTGSLGLLQEERRLQNMRSRSGAAGGMRCDRVEVAKRDNLSHAPDKQRAEQARLVRWCW